MPTMTVILGAGGHARVLIDCLLRDAAVRVHAVLDPDHALHGTTCLGVPVRGDDDCLDALIGEGVSHFVVGVGGVGDTGPRQRLFELGLSRRLQPLTVAHPTSECSEWAVIGPGSQLLVGSIVNAGAVLGANVIVNSGAIVEHDCRLGDHVHVATGATLSGNVSVGDLAHIGAGSVVRQSISVGARAVVGAGAVVVKDVAPGQTVIGNPARAMARRGEREQGTGPA